MVDRKLLKQVVWLAVIGALLILTALQLMRSISAPVATGIGLLLLAGAWFGLRDGGGGGDPPR